MIFFFFNDTATTEIYTLSLHDALPISDRGEGEEEADEKDIQKCLGPEARRHGRTRDEWKTTVKIGVDAGRDLVELVQPDRKSTRLNSSHSQISYAVFCLKKKKQYCT